MAEFILRLFLYERLWLPVINIACSLLSTTAVFTALWITGVDLNITALMAMTMIIGIDTEMGIFYVSEYAELAHAMEPRRALGEASRNRLRPITMTILAAILTLMPLALAISQVRLFSRRRSAIARVRCGDRSPVKWHRVYPTIR